MLSLSEGLLVIGCYLLMGYVGLPVFANFYGGVAIFLSPVGGYLIGFALYILLTRLFLHFFSTNTYSLIIANIAGATVQLIIGTIWLIFFTHVSLAQAMVIGFIPFVVPGLIKIYLVVLVVQRLLHLSLLN